MLKCLSLLKVIMMKSDIMTAENINKFENYIGIINDHLDKYKNETMQHIAEQRDVAEAMWYSLSAGGKRIRPVLVMEFCRVCGGDTKNAEAAACAIEMIHTFSLIHDDLPCMDNDDYRRGKPSCHKAYGEATALLAGDALENLAFGIIADAVIPDSVKVRLVQTLAKAVGVNGMIGGQVIDTEYEGKNIPEEMLLRMYSMKTSALLKAACLMGCICAEADEEKMTAAIKYAENLGLAFQIIDDILDITGNEQQLGKPIGSDAANGKITYASLNGLEKSNSYAAKLTENALDSLSAFENTEFLKELTLYLLKRSN